MKQWKVSLSVPVLLSHPMVYQFGNPVLGVCLPQRVICTVKTSKNSSPISSSVIKWCQQKVQKEQQSVSISIRYSVPKWITSGIAEETAKALAYAYWYLERPLTVEEMHSCIASLFRGKEVIIVCAIQSLHGGFSYSRREFSFLKQTSFLSMQLPKIWNNKLFCTVSHSMFDWNTAVEKGKELYNKSSMMMRQYLDEYEVLTKKIVTAITVENWELFQKSMSDILQHSFSQQNHLKKKMPLFMTDHVVELSTEFVQQENPIVFREEKQGVVFLAV